MYSYCFFCNTVKCALVAAAIRQKFGYDAFSPKIVQRKWIKGTCHEEIRDYLPGYVFVYSEQPITEFREIRLMEGVLRYLGQRDDGYQLMGDDRRFAEMLYANNGTIGIMKAYQEGDRVKLAKDMLGDFEGEIIKLDRRKGRAQVQYNFDGNSYKVWVGYEMIDDNAAP
ncbi:MAG: hypothetical protein IJ769_10300 [Clostridia bacterium]|nr:hypothetical protein [Clostridia bacterium]